MSRSGFLRNLRTAAGFLSPSVHTDHNGDNAKMTRLLKSAAIWLTPAAVEGYDEAEFIELAAETRVRLTKSVSDFKAIASKVPNDQPAPPDQAERALQAFRDILDVLKDYLDHDAVRAHQLLDGQTWPDYVVGFSCEAGHDSTGDPCLWITLMLRDDIPNRPDFLNVTNELRQKVADVLEKNGIDRWPYFRFGSAYESDLLYAKNP
jgi:hypothetical protein